jgi:hypothetical protein
MLSSAWRWKARLDHRLAIPVEPGRPSQCVRLVQAARLLANVPAKCLTGPKKGISEDRIQIACLWTRVVFEYLSGGRNRPSTGQLYMRFRMSALAVTNFIFQYAKLDSLFSRFLVNCGYRLYFVITPALSNFSLSFRVTWPQTQNYLN